MKGILYFGFKKKRKLPVTSQNDHVSLLTKLENILCLEGQWKRNNIPPNRVHILAAIRNGQHTAKS
jgi:hypothetical protein